MYNHICIYIYKYVHVYVCILYMHIYIHVYICMNVRIHIYNRVEQAKDAEDGAKFAEEVPYQSIHLSIHP